jgi:hypothetical protein
VTTPTKKRTEYPKILGQLQTVKHACNKNTGKRKRVGREVFEGIMTMKFPKKRTKTNWYIIFKFQKIKAKEKIRGKGRYM